MEQISGRRHRQKDQNDCQRENGAKVRSEISPGGVDGRGIEQGRKKQIKDQLRIEMDRRKAGDQSEDHTTVSRIEYGIRIFRATIASRATATRQIRINSILSTIGPIASEPRRN